MSDYGPICDPDFNRSLAWWLDHPEITFLSTSWNFKCACGGALRAPHAEHGISHCHEGYCTECR